MIAYGYGKNVSLGPLDRHFMHLIKEWRNDYATWRTCRQNDLISDYAQEKWYERQAQDPSIKMYIIKAEGKPVGVCGLTSIDPWNHRAEFSLYIAPNERKHGHGRAALQTLVSHGFYTLGLNCIWGESFEGNAAQKIFQDLGFKLEGSRRAFYYREGEYLDAQLYSLLRDEWFSHAAYPNKIPLRMEDWQRFNQAGQPAYSRAVG